MSGEVRDRLFDALPGTWCDVHGSIRDLIDAVLPVLADTLDQSALDKARVAELEAALGRVRALIDSWAEFMSEQDDGTSSVRSAAAAVRLCRGELIRALDGEATP